MPNAFKNRFGSIFRVTYSVTIIPIFFMTSANAPNRSIWDAARYAGQRVGDFVGADPNTIPVVTKPLQTAARLSCEIWGARPIDLPLYEGYDSVMREMCGPYFGDNNWDLPVSSGPSFDGGQCEGVLYNGEARTTVNGSPTPWVPFTNRPGPLTIIQTGDGVNSQGQALQDGDGNIIVATTDNSPPFDEIGVEARNIVRADGQPDECGNPPPNYNVDGNPPPLPPPSRDVQVGPFIIPVLIGDFDIDVTGQLVIPVTINGELNLNLFGDNPSGGSGQSGNPDRGPQLDTEDGDEEEAPDGRAICAAQVQIITPNTIGVTEIPLDGGDILTVPRHGMLTFEDERGFDTDTFNIRLLGQRIDCPFKEGAKRVRITMVGNARALVTLLLFPETSAEDE